MVSQLALLNEPATAIRNRIAARPVANFSNPESKVLDKAANLNSKPIEAALKSIFPTQKEETWLKRARRILGETAANLSDSELETYLTEFEFLLDSWIDDFEKQLFDNKTLREVLKEG